eukprot:5467204-Amphidinium_carterae.1
MLTACVLECKSCRKAPCVWSLAQTVGVSRTSYPVTDKALCRAIPLAQMRQTNSAPLSQFDN